MEPASAYNLRITAHNNAGTTIAEYYFETLTVTGFVMNAGVDGGDNFMRNSKSFLADPHLFAIFIVISFVIVFSTIGICFCLKNCKYPKLILDSPFVDSLKIYYCLEGRNSWIPYVTKDHPTWRHTIVTSANAQEDVIKPHIFSDPRLIFGRNDLTRTNVLDSKNPQLSDSHHSQQQGQPHREQFYATVRKLSAQQSPRDSESGLERIPEYSEDIYPYATFHLPDHENQSSNSGNRGPRKGLVYDSRDSTLSTGSTAATLKILRPPSVNSAPPPSTNISTEKRNRRKSKTIKSESEEYDSLNSDSDLSERGSGGGTGVVGTASRTESTGHLDDPELLNFSSMCIMHEIFKLYT